jgi:uncharacterized protein YukE
MNNSTTSTGQRWHGWARRSSRAKWRRLVQDAPSEREAMEQLRQATNRERFTDLCVLPAHRHPDDKGPKPAA